MLVLDVPARDQLSRQIEELRRTCRSVTVGRRCLQMCDGVLFIRGEGIVDVGVRGRNGRPARPSPHPSPVDAAGERGLLRPALTTQSTAAWAAGTPMAITTLTAS
jgi:hypothetical protein